MRITTLFSLKAIALDSTASTQEEILNELVELQATHDNIMDKAAYKKALYAREAEGSTYVDNGITVPHAKSDVVLHPSLAVLRLKEPVQYNPDDDGKTDLLFAIAAPQNGSLHVDMLARMMQMLMNEDFVEKLRTAKTPKEFLDCIDQQEQDQFGDESFTSQPIPQNGFRVLAVTACPNGIAHTYMAAEALAKAGDKLELPVKVETNGSDGAKNILTKDEIANCDGIIVAAEKNVETARFDGKPVLFTRVDDGIHKPEQLIMQVARGEVPVYHAKEKAADVGTGASDSAAHTIYKHLMNGVSHMLPFVVGGGIMIALAFLLDDYTIDPSNFGMNTPLAAFFKTVGNAAFGYMLPILAGFIAMSIADRPGLAVGFAGGVLAMNGSGFPDPGGAGKGERVAGYAMSNGVEYGSHFTQWAYKRIELREDNRFYIKDASAPTGDGTTDATEFQPAMIIDGVKYTTDIWTDTQPRACIGQSDKYEILMLVIEGRLWLEGINGTSVNTCSDILLQHGCMQAMNLDGGSSAMMWFDGKYVMRSSSPDNRYNGGRECPNAWVYKAAGTFEE